MLNISSLPQNPKAIDAQKLVNEHGAFLTVYDVMELLKVSRPVVDRMLKTGKLPAARFGGRQYRIRTDDFAKWWDREVKQEQRNILKGLL